MTSSIKEGLYDDLLISIDQEYCGETVAPPAELIPYLKGEKFDTEEEGTKIMQIYNLWTARLGRALGRTKDATQHVKILQEILNGLPEPYKTGVTKALIRLSEKT